MLVPRSGFIASEAAGSVNNSTLTSTLPAALTNGQILEMVFSSILHSSCCTLLIVVLQSIPSPPDAPADSGDGLLQPARPQHPHPELLHAVSACCAQCCGNLIWACGLLGAAFGRCRGSGLLAGWVAGRRPAGWCRERRQRLADPHTCDYHRQHPDLASRPSMLLLLHCGSALLAPCCVPAPLIRCLHCLCCACYLATPLLPPCFLPSASAPCYRVRLGSWLADSSPGTNPARPQPAFKRPCCLLPSLFPASGTGPPPTRATHTAETSLPHVALLPSCRLCWRGAGTS